MRYGERNWREMHDLTECVAVLPLGSTEQHGHHLPLLTDTLIVDEIVRRAEEALDDTALFLPTVWFGMSEHHRGFPGTISVRNETYTQVLIDILESLVGGGFRRIVALNAHGGNAVKCATATSATCGWCSPPGSTWPGNRSPRCPSSTNRTSPTPASWRRA